nr:ribonuclease H-like domain-containing protein [Tanacetum cinerariifolium]
MMTEEFCPPEEIQMMEGELWNLRVEDYIRGLSKNIKGEVTSSEPATLNKAVRMMHTLMEQKVKAIAEREADNKKRKWKNFQGGSSSGGGNNNSNQNNNNNPGQNVKCNRCGMQHYGNYLIKCNKYGKIGYKARDCWSKVVATGANAQSVVTCYGCGEKGHIKTNCPARNNPGRNGACGQAYALRNGDQNLRPNVVTAATPKTALPKPKSYGNRKNRKTCFVCKSLDHLIKDYNFYEKKMAYAPLRNHAQRGNHQQYARMPLPNPQRHVVPTAVLTKSKLVLINAARPVTAAVSKPFVTRPRQAKTVVTKPHSPHRRNINRSPSPNASTFPLKVTVAQTPVGNPQHALKDKGVIDSGCSRHMTGNMSYLYDFEEPNGGYVAFGGNPKGGKIFGKGKIRTGKLDFVDVYFVKELKFNFFSVLQMCDKKNNVLFTNTECLVLSPEFKLPNENQVLLRVP